MPDPAGLPGHEKALDGLLESLFSESSEDAGVRLESADRVASSTAPARHPTSGHLLNDPVVPPLELDTQTVPKTMPQMPGWAEGGFRVLLFRIGDFRFAMPLVLMRGVFESPDRLTRVPAQPAWHLGLVRHRGQSVVVADFGLLMGLQARCSAPGYLLLVGDGQGAIACDEIEDAVEVDPHTVRWARATVGKAWLVGLMTQQMCCLLDADAVAEGIRHG